MKQRIPISVVMAGAAVVGLVIAITLIVLFV